MGNLSICSLCFKFAGRIWNPYIVSALKYRPQPFRKYVVGQSAITQTLWNNAIRKEPIAAGPPFLRSPWCWEKLPAPVFSPNGSTVKDQDNLDPNQDFAFNIFELGCCLK